MIYFSTKYRSTQSEIMDDFEFNGAEMNLVLDDLKRVNRWLGGDTTTLQGLITLLRSCKRDEIIRIIDLGCGDGEQLRHCAKWLDRAGLRYELTGLDANEHILQQARKRSEGIDHIKFVKMDVLSEDLHDVEYDIAICTLFLHHFNEEESKKLLNKVVANAKVGVLINDLERSWMVFWLFRIWSRFLLRSKTARFDGLVSISSAFRRKELERMAAQIEGQHSIRWRWAFRYQWIIKKL